jgi:hypothetical protein
MSLPIYPFSHTEILAEITRISPHKAPGFVLLTGRILKQLPKEATTLLTTIYDSMLRLTYFPITWKFALVIMIPKPSKPPHSATSYRPISLLPLMSKLFERLLLKLLQVDTNINDLIPSHQFGFRVKHSTTQQCQWIVHEIVKCLEEKILCTAAFLDIQQAFDRVWHDSLLHKLTTTFPTPYYLLLKS